MIKALLKGELSPKETEGCQAGPAPRDTFPEIQAVRRLTTRRLSLSKKVLTSWWTGKQAPPPRPPSPVFAEILEISGRKNCRETIFALENGIFRRKNRPAPTVHAAGRDWKFERAATLSSSPGGF